MRFSITALMGFHLAQQAIAFSPHTPVSKQYVRGPSSSSLAMADMPPAANTDVPVIENSAYGPTGVRYSDFLKLVDSDKIEKVTFSSDGSELLGVDVDGARIKIEALPNDPELLTQLTTHKVRLESITRMQSIVMRKSNQFSHLYDRWMSLCFHNKKLVVLETLHKVSFSPPLSLLASSS